MSRYPHTTFDDAPAGILYQQHAPAIFAYVRQHTPTREDAEDILIEVFLAVLEKDTFAELSEKEQLTWLWRVTRNKIVDFYRRSIHRQGVDPEQLAATMYADEDMEPEQIVLQEEEYAHVQTLLRSLSASQQEVLRLRFAQDLRCTEIASRLGKREGTVRVILSRALNMLRSIYEQQ
jgi:RNA polymerase sigma-70 factor (ECF subfamily)